MSVVSKIKDNIKYFALLIKWAVIGFFSWMFLNTIKDYLNNKAEKKKLKAEVKKAKTDTDKLVKENDVLVKDLEVKEKAKVTREKKTNKFFRILKK